MLKIKLSPCKKDTQAMEFLRIYQLAENPRVKLVNSYDEADIIFVIDLDHKNIYADILSKPEHIIHYKKLVCYWEHEIPPEKIPGIYACGSIDAPATRGAPFYLWLITHQIPRSLPDSLAGMHRPYLFSFMGRNCNKVRQEVLRLGSIAVASSNYYLEDTTDSYPIFDSVKKQNASIEIMKRQRARYFDVLEKTKFALAPRGTGLSSIRQDEAMAYGCVPVIISDKLKLPGNVDWDRCSVRIKEKDIGRIPEILKALEDRFPEMSLASQEAYKLLFDPVNYWQYIESALIDIYQYDFDKRAPLAELRARIVLRGVQRTLYQSKLTLRRWLVRLH